MSLIPRSNFLDMDKFFDDFYAPLKREGGSLSSFSPPGWIFGKTATTTKSPQNCPA